MTWQTLSFSAMEGTPWINDGVMKFLFHAVAQRLHHLRDTHQIIFTMDTCGCHIRKDTLRCCGRLGVWPHLFPAKLTWLGWIQMRPHAEPPATPESVFADVASAGVHREDDLVRVSQVM